MRTTRSFGVCTAKNDRRFAADRAASERWERGRQWRFHKAPIRAVSLGHAREALSVWKEDYNTVRPHSGLGNLAGSASK